MRRFGLVVLFVLVLLVVCAGAYFGGQFLVQRFRQDFQPRPAWTPTGPTASPRAGQAWTPPALTADPAAQAPAPTPTRPTISTPVAPPSPTFAPITPAGQTPGPTATTELTETSLPKPTTPDSFPYVLARPVRDSSGDCPGNYVLGQVTDRSGNGLPEVRLHLVDEYSHEDTKVTKSGAGEVGRYDFPLFGAPRRFYLTVVDAAGNPLSATVEIAHGVGANPAATCHWVDWQRR